MKTLSVSLITEKSCWGKKYVFWNNVVIILAWKVSHKYPKKIPKSILKVSQKYLKCIPKVCQKYPRSIAKVS